MRNEAVVPSRLQNILLKYNSSLDLNFEQFLVDVVGQPGIEPVLSTINSSTCTNISNMINKVMEASSIEDIPSDFYDDTNKASNREEEEEGVELL